MKPTIPALGLVATLAAISPLSGAGDRALPSAAWPPQIIAPCSACHAETLNAPGPSQLQDSIGPGTSDERRRALTGLAPDVVIIDQLMEHYSAVAFDHRVHADMSALTNGCDNCHHGTQPGARIAPCRECHPTERSAGTLAVPSLKGSYHRQCLGCHRDWSHENACGYCHRERTTRTDVRHASDASDIVLTPHRRIEPSRQYVYQTAHEPRPFVTFHHIDHAQSFDLRCVDCHQSGSCSRCHGNTGQSTDSVALMPSCRGCHATNQCAFCHDHQPRPEFDHVAISGWDSLPQHAGVSCIDCHGSAGTFFTPSRNCRSCHGGLNASNFDHTMTGVPLRGSHARFDCVRCHQRDHADSPASCKGCHADRQYPAQLPGQRFERSDHQVP